MVGKSAVTAITIAILVCLASFAPAAVAQSDDWPDDSDSAEEVSPGTYSGTISSEDDRDYLRVAVQRGDTVTLTMSKEIRKDTWMSVNWAGGSAYVSDESGDSFSRKVTVEENGYVYVQMGSDTASEASESWELTIERNAGADEWADSSDEANEISPGTYGGQVNSPDDRDYARIPVQRGDTVTLTMSKEIRKDTWMSVNWPGGSAYVSDESGDSFSRKVTVEENGYVYVQMGSDTVQTGTETWELNVERNAGADEWADSSDEANEISPGTYGGQVNSPDDRDYARIPVQRGDTVTLSLQKSASKDTWMSVNWAGGSAYVSDESGDSLSRKVTVEENGYVYVQMGSDTVQTGTEAWELNVQRSAGADEWPDSADEAREVSRGAGVSGEVNSPDDRDYVRVPVRTGDTVTFRLEKMAGKDTWMSVNWPGGSAYVSDENGDLLTRTVTAEENGYVYVQMGSDTVQTGTEGWGLSVESGASSESSPTTTETTAWTTTATETTTLTTTTTTWTTTTETTTLTTTTTGTPTTAWTTTTTTTSTPTTATPTPTTETTTPMTETPTETTTTRTTEAAMTTAQDSDGDGVVDAEDYAPSDPNVQEKSDVESDGSIPGFGVGGAVVALLLTALLVSRRS